MRRRVLGGAAQLTRDSMFKFLDLPVRGGYPQTMETPFNVNANRSKGTA